MIMSANSLLMPQTLPYETPNPKKLADELYELKALTICHYVLAGVAYLGAVSAAHHPGAPLVLAILVIYGTAQLVSALCMQQRRFRTVTLAISAINCAIIPLGTALGAATIKVLSRPAIMEMYRNKAQA
jgi:predicted MFS family arabinose efflux permease